MSEFSVASIFSNHCVLQREKPICIFGEGEKGIVNAKLFYNEKIISENSGEISNGKWLLFLPEVSAKNNCTLVVESGESKKIFTDVSIGEVWLAGGQSNMEREFKDCAEHDEVNLKENPNVRFYYTQKNAWKDDSFFEGEKNSCWQTWESEWRGSWSVIGYFFAKKIAKEIGVTVGIIGCNWGGTSASCWISRQRLEKDFELKTYLDEYEKETSAKSIEQQCREYDDYVKENDLWQAKSAEIYAKNPQTEWNDVLKILGPCPWPGPKSCKNPYRPNGLYECMIQRVAPYTLKGFLYYQGESDDHKPQMYEKLMRELIDQWRCEWNDDELPFVFVQLPDHRYKGDPDYKNWCLIREAQLKIWKTIKNTGMITAWGYGDFNEIHPLRKKIVADRMADTALGFVYKTKEPSSVENAYPVNMIVKNQKAIIKFKNAKDGFLFKNDEYRFKMLCETEEMHGNKIERTSEKAGGFEIAGIDGVFYPAKVVANEDSGHENEIEVFCDNVKSPEYVRYGWFNYGPVTFFTKNGLPVSPFRISKNKTFLEENQNNGHAQIQQIMVSM